MTDLGLSNETLNSTFHQRRICSFRPCKRMTCIRCVKRRKHFFIQVGLIHIKRNDLDCFVTVAWPKSLYEDPWFCVITLSKKLSVALAAKKAGAYIRAISLGEKKSTPHVHFIVKSHTAQLIKKIARLKWKKEVIVQCKPTYNSKGILSYLFDRNFIPAAVDPTRPRGIRILAASRPMRTGFPSQIDERKLWGKYE